MSVSGMVCLQSVFCFTFTTPLIMIAYNCDVAVDFFQYTQIFSSRYILKRTTAAAPPFKQMCFPFNSHKPLARIATRHLRRCLSLAWSTVEICNFTLRPAVRSFISYEAYTRRDGVSQHPGRQFAQRHAAKTDAPRWCLCCLCVCVYTMLFKMLSSRVSRDESNGRTSHEACPRFV